MRACTPWASRPAATKDHWPDTFGEVLREEGLFALNAMAAAFPPMEDYDKFRAVAEYADANTSKEYIALAEHLDEFEFFPEIRDEDDLVETWIDAHPYYACWKDRHMI